jgi:hypothetical protein
MKIIILLLILFFQSNLSSQKFPALSRFRWYFDSDSGVCINIAVNHSYPNIESLISNGCFQESFYRNLTVVRINCIDNPKIGKRMMFATSKIACVWTKDNSDYN